MKLAALLACLLAMPCFAQTVTLTLVGGYRVPTNTVGGQNTRYLGGCWDLRNGYWINLHGVDQGISEYTEPETLGDPESDYEEWPLLVATGRYAQPFSTVTNIGPYGVKWLDADTVLCSGRKSYRSGFEGNWMCTYNLETDTETLIDMTDLTLGDGEHEDNQNFHQHQAFGAGFFTIPEPFATNYCQGRTIGAGRGGYDVLWSPLGPAGAALDYTGDPEDRLLVLVDHPTNLPARRSGNYTFPDPEDSPQAQLPAWQDPAGSGPLDGYWIAGDCGNPAWVPGVGLMYPARQVDGTIDYRAQGDSGSLLFFGVGDTSHFYSEESDGDRGSEYGDSHREETFNQSLPDATITRKIYIYSEAELAEVAQGSRDPWACTPQVITFPPGPYTWNNSRSNATEVIGLYWDAGRGYLWVCINQVWNDSRYAVLAAYTVGSGRAQRLTLRSGSTLTLEVAE